MVTWTMTEARRRFRELLDRANDGQPTRITRRGEVTAVVVAPRDFERLRDEQPTFVESLRRFRADTNPDDLLDDELEGLRVADTGRVVDV